MINPNFVYIGVILQLVGGGSYLLLDTIKGKVRPNRVSWLLWSLAPLIAFYAEIRQGVGMESYATFVVGFVPFLIFLASFINKKAQWKIQKLDVLCGALSVAGLILWLILKVGNIAIFFSILADGLASLPTIIKSWKEPQSENVSVYFFGMVNAVIGLLVIKTWNFENYGFLVYISFVCLVMVFLVQFKLGAVFKKMIQ